MHITQFLNESKKLHKDSIFLKPSFQWAYSALIGQMEQSVVIGLPLTARLRNATPITISEIQLWSLPQSSVIIITVMTETMALTLPRQFESESDDETLVELVEQPKPPLQGWLLEYIFQWYFFTLCCTLWDVVWV